MTDDIVALITIKAHLGTYPLTSELGEFMMSINRAAIRYWDAYRKLAVKEATKIIDKLLDEIKAGIDKQEAEEKA